MVCYHPQYVYQRRSMPIECGKNEELLHKYNRVSFKNAPHTYQTKIPCGHCLGCILDKASDWATRIWCEQQLWTHSCFVTLTYNNGKRTIKGQEDKDSLPRRNGYMTLCKQDIQDFKKRLRKHCKGIQEWENPRTHKIERPIRTFEAGEYGPTGGRPHYHMAILNWQPDDLEFYKYNKQGEPLYKSKKLQKIWGCGFVVIGLLNEKSAGYIARYTMKKAKEAKTFRRYYWTKDELDKKTGEYKDKRHYKTREGKIEPEFLTMSRGVGLGRLYFEQNFDKIKRNNGIYVSGKLKRIPRYFKKLWEKKNWQDYHQWRWQFMNECQKLAEEKIKLLNYPQNYNFEEIEFLYLQQQEKILLDKAESLKRDNIET